MEKQFTPELREKIRLYSKNKLDISELIKDYSLKDENLSYCIIKNLKKIDSDISNCNFAHSKIGSEDVITSIIRTKMQNCNFEGARFIGKIWMRNCDARNCNFKNADVHNVEYQNTNFYGSSFCEAIIRISSRSGFGCIFDENLIKELTKYWNVEVILKPKSK